MGEGELWGGCKDGVAFLEKLSIYSLKDAHNKVVNCIGVFSDIFFLYIQVTVAHQVQHDFLMNLPNRLLFRDRFQAETGAGKKTARKNLPFCILIFDLF